MTSAARVLLPLLLFLGVSAESTADDAVRAPLCFYLHNEYKPVVEALDDLLHNRPGDHAFNMTAYESERNAIHSLTDWYAPPPERQLMGWVFIHPAAGTIPLYRYRKGDDHFFTTDAVEGERAVNVYEYQQEGICCYISPGPQPDTTPLYRLRKGGFHVYTTDIQVRDVLTIQQGYVKEGDTAGYVWTKPVNDAALNDPNMSNEQRQYLTKLELIESYQGCLAGN